jgi:hypothetical protein
MVHVNLGKSETPSKITRAKKAGRHGSGGTELALQARSPEFKPPYCQKKIYKCYENLEIKRDQPRFLNKKHSEVSRFF